VGGLLDSERPTLIPYFLDDASVEENELAHEKWCNDLAAKFLCVFVLDRFGDFVSDQVYPQSEESYLTPAL
jgi:hypothetical protein